MEEKYMKSKKIIMITMCCLICVMAIGYAAFATNLTINGTANITSTWKVLFTKIEEVSKTSGVTIIKVPTAEGTNATFNVDLKSPGDKIVYKITVANQGTLDAIINDITASETGSDAIKFEITGIKKGDKLAKSTTTTFNVTISYDESITSQPALTDNTLTININYVQDAGQTVTSENPIIKPARLSAAILKDNAVQADTNIDFSQASSDTNGKGLFYTNKNTEDGKTTYYFRGTVENNYVKLRNKKINSCTYNDRIVRAYDSSSNGFLENASQEQCLSTNVCETKTFGMIVGLDEEKCTGYYSGTWIDSGATYGTKDELWRIVRINEDGSIRLITEDSVGMSRFNESSDDNAYVGYMYGTATSTTYAATHTNTNSSTIKEYLDTWYQDNLVSYSSLIADPGFCGDRSMAPKAGIWVAADTALGYAKNSTVYGGMNRLRGTTVAPQFACPQSNDLYTTATSTKGNKALTYPIGLMTVDEITYTGRVYGVNQGSSYLINEGSFWTLSPWNVNLSASVSIFGVRFSSAGVRTIDGVRPVISLISTVEITSGDGTINNPYVIKTN